jgi:hypothetical protein
MDHFYVTLNPSKSALTSFGQFNPGNGGAELVSRFSKWAAQNSGGKKLSNGDFFWCGPAGSLGQAIGQCQAVSNDAPVTKCDLPYLD